MRYWWRFLLILAVGACSLWGQRKEYMELQREVALFGDQLRTMQRLIDEKLAELARQAQQATSAANATNASVAELDKRIEGQSRTLTAPVATIGSKVDQMSGEFQILRETVGAMNARLARLEQQLLDVSTAIKTIQSPLAAPPADAAIPAETLFQNAMRDRAGGNLDLALRQFTDYVQVYGATEQAATAQYYIGDILYRSEKYREAVAAFDRVLTDYLRSDRAPDAHYMKAMALWELGETSKAASELNLLIKRFPKDDLAGKARTDLKSLSAPAASPRSKSK